VFKERGQTAPDPIMLHVDGRVVSAAEMPQKPEEATDPGLTPWDQTGIDIVSIAVGREWVWDDWCRWLLTCEVPAKVSLFLVDNSEPEDGETSQKMRDFAVQCMASCRFQTVSITRGTGPCGARGSGERDRNISDTLNMVLPMTSESFVFILDDDVIPPPDALRRLHAAWLAKAVNGARPGLISGSYPSAGNAGLLVAGLGEHRWERSVSASACGEQLTRVDFAGNGCLLADGPAVRSHLPLESSTSEGWRMGPDAWLSRRLRQSGFTVWLDTSLRCEHRYNAPM